MMRYVLRILLGQKIKEQSSKDVAYKQLHVWKNLLYRDINSILLIKTILPGDVHKKRSILWEGASENEDII